jgi:hypothetical protein
MPRLLPLQRICPNLRPWPVFHRGSKGGQILQEILAARSLETAIGLDHQTEIPSGLADRIWDLLVYGKRVVNRPSPILEDWIIGYDAKRLKD